jgi:hypothetical protein
MPNFAGNLIGYPQVNRGRAADSTKRFELGQIVTGVDAFFGGGEFVYCIATGTIDILSLVTVNASYSTSEKKWIWRATVCPDTANLGQTVGVATASAVANDYLFVQIAGITPLKCDAAVNDDTAIGVADTGQGGALSNGKQILNCRVCGVSSTTVVKTNCTNLKGSVELTVADAQGWFIGCYLSGTGVAGGATVADISPDGKTVVMSAASTAAITGTVTGTYNNSTIYYNLVMMNRPFLQGQTA